MAWIASAGGPRQFWSDCEEVQSACCHRNEPQRQRQRQRHRRASKVDGQVRRGRSDGAPLLRDLADSTDLVVHRQKTPLSARSPAAQRHRSQVPA